MTRGDERWWWWRRRRSAVVVGAGGGDIDGQVPGTRYHKREHAKTLSGHLGEIQRSDRPQWWDATRLHSIICGRRTRSSTFLYGHRARVRRLQRIDRSAAVYPKLWYAVAAASGRRSAICAARRGNRTVLTRKANVIETGYGKLSCNIYTGKTCDYILIIIIW